MKKIQFLLSFSILLLSCNENNKQNVSTENQKVSVDSASKNKRNVRTKLINWQTIHLPLLENVCDKYGI